MTAKALIVLNPNSNTSVTDGIDRAMDPLRAWGIPIRCVTSPEGPRGIESQAQADRAVPPMLDLAKALEPEALGYVVACFSDPGLHALRDETALPVVGIMEAGVHVALRLGHRFGVIAILPNSVPRHLRAFGAMGVLSRLAGDRPLGLSVAELADRDRTVTAMAETGRRLRDEDGADALVMGCAGMAQYRDWLEGETGLPVVEPCQAAAAAALGQIALGLSHRPTPRT